MCKAVPSSDDNALFLLPNLSVVTYTQFQNKLRQCVEKVGLNPSLYSTHSFRRGGASLAFRAKIPADKIKLLGDWKSDCYRKYLNFEFEDKLLVAREMRQFIQKQSSVSF